MRRIDYIVPADYDGRKVIHFLRGSAGCSDTLVRALKLHKDGILLNGVHIRTIDRLHEGDMLSITLHDTPTQMQLSEIDVPILYEDTDIIIYNKPANMACHPSKSLQQDTLANVFATYCAKKGIDLTCRILNRLDKDTSGAVLIAKNAFAAAALTGQVEKIYLAAVSGTPTPLEGIIDAPIDRPDPIDLRRAVMQSGKRAITEYKTVSQHQSYSMVACTLPTGRTHQIRVHMRHIGCPLLGDELYEGPMQLIKRQALHCKRLQFMHPITQKLVDIEAPIPKDMQKLIDR